MKRYRYSDASEERRKEIYLEELDKKKSMEQSRYMAGGLGVLCMLGFIAVAGYTTYPFLEMADKYKDNIEMRLVHIANALNIRKFLHLLYSYENSKTTKLLFYLSFAIL